MALNILGISAEPDCSQPSRQRLLQAAEACSLTATTKKQFLQKLDALSGIMPVKRNPQWLDFLPFKLLGTIREDAERLIENPEVERSRRSGAEDASDKFYTTAGDVFIEIVKVQPKIRQMVEAVVHAGGDIEITAHNQARRITPTLVEQSGLRHVVFHDKGQISQHQKRQVPCSAGPGAN